MINTKFYDQFHADTNPQSFIINKRNYTYNIILKVLDEYIKENSKILDIGCGAGTLSLYLAKNANHQVLGLDISQKAIEACKESAKRLDLHNVSFKQIDFLRYVPKRRFDIVLCLEVIEHLKEDKHAVAKIFKLLKPDGLVILSAPSKNAPLYRIGYSKGFDKRVGHLRRYDKTALISIFKKEGFNVLAIKETEGLLRNFLFLNPYAGKLIRFIRFPISIAINYIDNLLLTLFGESDIFIISQKP